MLASRAPKVERPRLTHPHWLQHLPALRSPRLLTTGIMTDGQLKGDEAVGSARPGGDTAGAFPSLPANQPPPEEDTAPVTNPLGRAHTPPWPARATPTEEPKATVYQDFLHHAGVPQLPPALPRRCLARALKNRLPAGPWLRTRRGARISPCPRAPPAGPSSRKEGVPGTPHVKRRHLRCRVLGQDGVPGALHVQGRYRRGRSWRQE